MTGALCPPTGAGGALKGGETRIERMPPQPPALSARILIARRNCSDAAVGKMRRHQCCIINSVTAAVEDRCSIYYRPWPALLTSLQHKLSQALSIKSEFLLLAHLGSSG